MTRRGQSVVLISLDTLRYDCVGIRPEKVHLASYGLADLLSTPNLDRFFSESAYFVECLSPAPLTTPAHASVMTGLYPGRHGARALIRWSLAEDVGTLAEQLRVHGYHTVAVLEDGDSNWMRAGTNVLRGFDVFFRDEVEACRHCAEVTAPVLLFIHTWDIHLPYCCLVNARVRGLDDTRKDAAAQVCRELDLAGPAEDVNRAYTELAERAASRARERLGGRSAARLFLRWYVQGVNWFDRVRWPGVVAALREAKLYDDAVVAVFSDHGDALLPDGPGLPLSHTTSLLEDAVRVPLALRGPGFSPGVDDREASLVDLAPTVTDCLGTTAETLGLGGSTDGRSLLGARSSWLPRRRFAEAWCPDQTSRVVEDAAGGRLRARLLQRWLPGQACVWDRTSKVLWHPGPVRLGRFGARRSSRLRRAVRRRLPAPLVDVLRRVLRRRPPVSTAGSAHGRPAATEWRPAPVFAVDLAADPLEAQPRRLAAGRMTESQAQMLSELQGYWEGSRLGPLVQIGDGRGEGVLERLEDLGYA